MTQSISLRCRCGAVRGTTSPLSERAGTHIVCYCNDCRAYLYYLDRPELLDAGGGTDIFQMAPGDLTITRGVEHVHCVRLYDKGMHRFYAACCRTPIGNTLGARLPFVGVVHAFMDITTEAREALLGRRTGIMARFATGPTVPGAADKMAARLMVRIVGNMLRWVATGRGRSPLFRPDGHPIGPVEVLTASSRALLSQSPAR